MKIKCIINKFENLTKGKYYVINNEKFIGNALIYLINDDNDEEVWVMKCWFN